MSSFQMIALPFEPFAPLFDESDPALQARGVRRMVVDENGLSVPDQPC